MRSDLVVKSVDPGFGEPGAAGDLPAAAFEDDRLDHVALHSHPVTLVSRWATMS
jgi:hypothetical protein